MPNYKILCRVGNDPSSTSEASDYLGTLLRDPSSSHILEIITSRCPPSAFDKLWAVYFKGALPRLAVHPVANFVLAKALERVSESQLSEVCAELRNTWHKLISKLCGAVYFEIELKLMVRYFKDGSVACCY